MRRPIPQLLAAWAVIAAAAAAVAATVDLRADIGFFLPEGDDPAMRLIADQLREGTGSNLVLMAIGGGDRDRRIRAGERLTRALSRSGAFVFVSNGTPSITKADAEALSAYRYVLNPPLPATAFTEKALRDGFERAVAALGTAAGAVVKTLLPRDPTLRTLEIAEFWAASGATSSRPGPWLTSDGDRALVVALPRGAAYDFSARERLIAEIRAAFDEVAGRDGLTLQLGGPSIIALETRDRIRADAQWLTIVSTVLVVGFLLFLFRSPGVLAALAVPVAGGLVAATAAVQILFGHVHGVTLAFGGILIGIAVDYAIHLFAHAADGGAPRAITLVWPTLRLGAATTVVAFLPMVFSGFPGVVQLGVFAAAGLTTAAAITRWLLPALAPERIVARGLGTRPLGVLDLIPARPAMAAAIAAGLAAAIYLALHGGALWSNDLRALSPVPADAIAFDSAVRADLGAPDVRRLIVVHGNTAEDVLRRQEDLRAALQIRVESGGLAGFDMAARYLPSARTQAAVRAALPDPETLARNLSAALAGLPFRAGAFAPFTEAVERVRTSPPVTGEAFLAGPFGWRIAPMLYRRGDEWVGPVTLSGIADPAGLEEAAGALPGGGAHYVDLKTASDRLMIGHRSETLEWIALGAAAALVLLFAGVRAAGPILRIATPIAVTVLVTLAVLYAAEGALTIIHVMALLLVAGLGLDYALFLNRATDREEERDRAAFAVVASSITTITVFAVLAFSRLPVLNSMGKAVALGAALAMVMAYVFRNERRMN